MKFIIAFVCFAGIAVVSAAPVAEESSALSQVKAEESFQERAAEIPVAEVPPMGVEEKAFEPEQVEEKAFEPEQVEEKAFELEQAAEKAFEPEQAQEKAELQKMEEQVEKAVETAVRAEEKAERADRSMVPSAREIIDAVEAKYLTPDGRALLKSLIPIA